MESKDYIDYHMQKELGKTYSSPDHVNRGLIVECREKEEFKIISIISFIISQIQGLLMIIIGIIFISDVFCKIIIIGTGILLLQLVLSLYILAISKEAASI